MRVKQFIAWILLTVYLLAVGGSATLSLSCKCVAMQARSNHSTHICSCCCEHEQIDCKALYEWEVSEAETAAHARFKAPCCGNHHSTEIDLYTGNSSESERQIRLLVLDLPAIFISESADIVVATLSCEQLAQRTIPDLLQAHTRSAGLRAPPVSA